ncbi:hypothetical protein B296_00051301, partial [Ensete ventricosum]
KLYLEANPNRDHISWIPPPPGPPTTEKAAPAPVLLTETGCHLPRASDRHRHNAISRPSSPPVSNPEPRSSAQPSTPLDGDRNGHGHDQRLPLPGTWKPSSVGSLAASRYQEKGAGERKMAYLGGKEDQRRDASLYMCTNVAVTIAGRYGRAESPATCSQGDVVPLRCRIANSTEGWRKRKRRRRRSIRNDMKYKYPFPSPISTHLPTAPPPPSQFLTPLCIDFSSEAAPPPALDPTNILGSETDRHPLPRSLQISTPPSLVFPVLENNLGRDFVGFFSPLIYELEKGEEAAFMLLD